MSNDNNSVRFAALFRGYTKRYGDFKITGENARGKKTGIVSTVDKAITQEHYARHIKGERGIGVIPLREDDTVNFAAIDLDEYPGSEKFKVHRKDGETNDEYNVRVAKEHRDWADDICIATRDVPVFPTWSKSGGLHLWLFSKTGVTARTAIDFLKNIAHHLGHADCEIFPKQTTRHSEQDTGNWINLPFFGETRNARLIERTDTGFDVLECDLDEFLDIAEQLAENVTQSWLNEENEIAAKEIGTPTEMWYDGPPCLQRLIIGDPRRIEQLQKDHDRKVRDGAFDNETAEKKSARFVEEQRKKLQPELVEGGRDKTFFNVALYLARQELQVFSGSPNETKLRSLEDAFMKVHDEWKERTGQDGLTSAELKRLAKQGNKDRWNYTCKDTPLCNFCSKAKCKKRDFGIGSRKDDFSTPIESFTIVESKPPLFFFEFEGHRVSMEGDELVNQHKFSLALVNQCHRTFPRVQQAVFDDMINDLLKAATKVAPQTGGDIRHDVGEFLLHYLERAGFDKGTGHDMKFRKSSRQMRDGEWVLFKLDNLSEYLRAKGIVLKRHELLEMIARDFGALEFNTTDEDRKSIKGWKAKPEHVSNVVNR